MSGIIYGLYSAEHAFELSFVVVPRRFQVPFFYLKILTIIDFG